MVCAFFGVSKRKSAFSSRGQVAEVRRCSCFFSVCMQKFYSSIFWCALCFPLKIAFYIWNLIFYLFFSVPFYCYYIWIEVSYCAANNAYIFIKRRWPTMEINWICVLGRRTQVALLHRPSECRSYSGLWFVETPNKNCSTVRPSFEKNRHISLVQCIILCINAFIKFYRPIKWNANRIVITNA